MPPRPAGEHRRSPELERVCGLRRNLSLDHLNHVQPTWDENRLQSHVAPVTSICFTFQGSLQLQIEATQAATHECVFPGNSTGFGRPVTSRTHLGSRFPGEQIDLFRFGDHVGSQRAHQVHLLPVTPRQDAGMMQEYVGVQSPVVPRFLWYRDINCPKTKDKTFPTVSTSAYPHTRTGQATPSVLISSAASNFSSEALERKPTWRGLLKPQVPAFTGPFLQTPAATQH